MNNTTKKRGRPRKPKAQHLLNYVCLRFNESDHKALSAQAKASGVTLQVYLRQELQKLIPK